MYKVISLLTAAAFLLLFTACDSPPITYTDLSPSESEFSSTTSYTSSTPVKNEVHIDEPYVFTPDHTKIPTDQLEYLEAKNSVSEWKALVNAICSGASDMAYPGDEQFEAVSHVLKASPFADSILLEFNDDRVCFEYIETETIESFNSSLSAVFTESLGTGYNALETLISLYRTAASFKYEDHTEYSLCRTLCEQSGNSKEIAAALQYMLTQAGFRAYIAYENSSINHNWVIAEIGGVFYHFDPVFEAAVTNGQGLSYFGMSDAAHAAATGSNFYSMGFQTSAEQYENMCPSNTLDQLFSNATQYQLDTHTNKIILQYGFKEDSPTVFSTEAFTK